MGICRPAVIVAQADPEYLALRTIALAVPVGMRDCDSGHPGPRWHLISQVSQVARHDRFYSSAGPHYYGAWAASNGPFCPEDQGPWLPVTHFPICGVCLSRMVDRSPSHSSGPRDHETRRPTMNPRTPLDHNPWRSR